MLQKSWGRHPKPTRAATRRTSEKTQLNKTSTIKQNLDGGKAYTKKARNDRERTRANEGEEERGETWRRGQKYRSVVLPMVKYWGATLELTKEGKLHAHVMLQFTKQVHHTTARYTFDGLRARADQHDLLGEGWCRKKLQESFDRAFFYCWAEKLGKAYDADGTPCRAGNYEPAWTTCRFTYPVRWKWAFNLWWKYKLSDERYDAYLFLCKDGSEGRKRYLGAWRQRKEAEEQDAEMEAVVKRVRHSVFTPFPSVPAAQAWLSQFERELDRFPFLVALGPSRSRKTEWAKSLFKSPLELKIGALDQFPEAFRRFSRKVHDAVVLDDVRDAYFFVLHQEKLQGKYNGVVEFASTAGGTCAFWKDLWKVPVVLTVNNSTRNLSILATDDFCSKPANVVFLSFASRPGEVAPCTSWPLA